MGAAMLKAAGQPVANDPMRMAAAKVGLTANGLFAD
jgi:hypothetical protein